MMSAFQESERRIEMYRPGVFTLVFCDGGVFRSQIGAEILRMSGINALAVAAGDVTKQRYQGEVPLHVVAYASLYMIDLQWSPIQRVTKELWERATHGLVLCERFHLPADIVDPNDPRLFFHEVRDVPALFDRQEYDRVTLEVDRAVGEFISVKLQAPQVETSSRWSGVVSGEASWGFYR